MERITLTESNVQEVAARAAAVLRAGGVILYPTDTLYGLGTDALSTPAVAQLYTIKGRDEHKPIHAIVCNVDLMRRYAEMNEAAEKLAAQFLPGPLTLVLKKKSGFDSGIAKNIETIGLRIPKNDFCLELAKAYEAPYTTTSANRAGETPRQTVDDVLSRLEADAIDLVIDAGELAQSAPSTVVDVSGGEVRILREGAIAAAAIAAALGKAAV